MDIASIAEAENQRRIYELLDECKNIIKDSPKVPPPPLTSDHEEIDKVSDEILFTSEHHLNDLEIWGHVGSQRTSYGGLCRNRPR